MLNVHEDSIDKVIPLDGYFVDNEGQTITYGVTSSNTSVVQASIDATTSPQKIRLNFLKDMNSDDDVVITVSATSGGKSRYDFFNVTVNPVNDQPIITQNILNKTIDENESFEIDLKTHFSDVEEGTSLTLFNKTKDFVSIVIQNRHLKLQELKL